MYVPTDYTIVSALESAVGVAEESDVPLVTADTDSVSRGALAALGFNYHEVGKETGAVVVRILNGEAGVRLVSACRPAGEDFTLLVDRGFAPDMPVVCERFTLIYPTPANA